MQEQIDWMRAFNSPNFNNAWLLNGGENNLYSGSGSGAGGSYYYTLYYWLNNSQVNKYQRYLGRVLFLDNGIAQTGVNKLTIMALGSGMKIQTPDESKQRKIDEWQKINKWKRKEVEAFKRRIIDGEVFFRVFGDQVRFVDPDLVYCNATDNPQSWQGVISDNYDQEEILGFEVHPRNYQSNTTQTKGEFVPIEEMQHRKLNSHFGARRGFSLLLPVATDLFNCDRLLNNVMATSNVLAKIAFWRKHKANQASVMEFRSKINNQSAVANRNGLPEYDNIDNIPAGSIPDIPDETDIQFPDAQSLDQYNIILESTLRKISSQFNLPAGIFNVTHDDGAYNAQMVTNSFVVRSIEAMQEEWKEFNLELLEMCGFDTNDIQIIAPEVAVVDADCLVKECEFLLTNRLASKNTIAEKFEINYEEELELIKQDVKDDEVLMPEPDPMQNPQTETK